MKRSPSLTQRGYRSVVALILCFAMTPVAYADIRGDARPGGVGAKEAAAKDADRLPLREGAVDARKKTAPPEDAEYVEGEALVRFTPGLNATARSYAHGRVGATSVKSFDLVPGLELVRLPRGKSVSAAVSEYRAVSGVSYSQPNYIYRALATLPNDTLFDTLWGLRNTGQTGGTAGADINATEAWDITTGSEEVVVAVLDTGIDYNHPDLVDNMWVNPGEIAGNGNDDDGNGYVDDVHGIDTTSGSSDPIDRHGHGTHCGGTIGAKGDNALGIVGVNWNVSLMAVKMLDDQGSGTSASSIEAFQYAGMMGADIISGSFGGYYDDAAQRDAIEAVDALFVFAAGNDGNNNDTRPFSPAGIDLDHILAVGASDHNDEWAQFPGGGASNHGARTVDVFAPGVDIMSTVPIGVSNASLGDGDVFYSEDFTDVSDWTFTDFAHAPWAQSTAAYTSPPASIAHLGYVNDEASYADSPSIDCSAADSLALKAKVRYNLENNYAWLTVYVHDGTTWHEVKALTGTTGGTFQDLWVDVSDLLDGQSDVRISFGLESDDSIDSSSGYDGAYVDDVQLVAGATHPGEYVAWNGTSMAAPHVSGVAALLLAHDPTLSARRLKYTIMNSVDPKSGLGGRCVTGGRVNALAALNGIEDSAPPVSTAVFDPATPDGPSGWYLTVPRITIEATDERSGVDYVEWRLNGGAWTSGSRVTGIPFGRVTLEHRAVDLADNTEAIQSVEFKVAEPLPPVLAVEGDDRYGTAVEASKLAYPDGAEAVIIATGRNWPDALGGSALAGALEAPILLVTRDAVPAVTAAEIGRLGATRAVILGGEAAVGPAVQSSLGASGLSVERIGGASRYQTADLVASRVKSILGSDYDGTAFVATGANFPDALAAAPLAAANGWPLYLAHPASGLSATTSTAMSGTTNVLILGGTGVVSSATENALRSTYGSVSRLAGASRYDTAAAVAGYAVSSAGHSWNRVGITTGQRFPDALAGGVVQGRAGSIMLLTRTDSLESACQNALSSNRDDIRTVTFFGGASAVSPAVRTAVRTACGMEPDDDPPVTGDVFYDGFESWPGPWETENSPTWAPTTHRASSGSYSAYCAGSQIAPPGPYGNNMWAWMEAGPLDFSSVTSAQLSFDLWLDSEYLRDGVIVGVSTDGVDFTPVGVYTGWTNGWLTESVGLGSYAGASAVWITFAFESGSSITAEGAYIDEVRITTSGPSADSITRPTLIDAPTIRADDTRESVLQRGDAGNVFGRAQAIDALLGDPDPPLAPWSLQ